MPDLISDTFTLIRNAVRANKEEAFIPYSKVFSKICEILKEEGYIENYKDVDLGNLKKIKIYLKYDKKRSILSQLKRVSKPGRRVFVDKRNIPQTLRGFGISIISTSKGILTDKQAKELGVGGELLGKVW